ncbi:3-deoxy-manno-octulosonate cytidylyltransferase [Aliarcobacter skirrowii]|uniref:3-deoxy-manno-octulosonate cytidylyltransferase n=1 Tax=Aliarcobacter skirrowii TaxID=28200 RepID=UPI00083604EE|nr:3-deoxy-manno-octulosonate cytidylyltransferase [Aliarcobacter skirrowii]
MHKIQILDCTLRDGGYINNWEFGDKNIQKVIKSLIDSNIEIIECGFLDSNIDKEQNTTRFKTINHLNTLLKDIELKQNQLLVAMIDYTKYDLNSLPVVTKDSKITGLRVAFRKSNFKEALEEMKIIIQKGYNLFVQPMSTSRYSQEELDYLISTTNNLNPYALYIVDTQGSIFPENFKNLFEKFVSKMSSNIKLGFHSHNNMQLSYAIAIEFINIAKEKEIIIDSSIYGMGRGAGNLNTELLADYLNKKHNKDYKIENILELIDSYFNALHKNFGWGYSLAHFLSASNETHPNYASFLLDTKRLSINEIKILLEKIPNEDKYEFDKSLIENIYFSYNSSKIKEINPPKFDKSKKILLVGSGINLNEKIDEIKQNRDSYQIIALNHKPNSFKPDFYFFNSIKRYEEFSEYISKDKIILSSNIDIDSKYSVDYKKLSKIDDDFYSDITAIMMINFLVQNGFTNVYLVGVDGFSKTSLNYSYDESNKVIGNNAIDELNISIQKAFDKLSQKIKIEFITSSIFKIKSKPKIIGVIPARYKSSRFEGKPLCIIDGVPMIKRTYLQAKQSKFLDDLIVATEDKRIEDYCKKENIPVIMTSDNCLTGTDRIAEVSKSMDFDLYVNIQGDEPVIDPKSIEEIVNEYLKYGDEYIAYNLYKNIDEKDEIFANTIIKTIVNEKDELMYMSRLGVPFNKSNIEAKYKKQICVYGFTKQALDVFSSRTKTLNEQYEDIEILRFVDMGYKVKMKETNVDSIAVDVPSDVEKVEKFLEKKGLK